MEIQNKIGEQVFDKLRSKFRQITLGDEEGNSTQDPQDAVFFNFNYTDNQGHDHGNITISLIDRTMKIYYSKNISTELDGSELTEWYAFLQDMRKTAMSNLYGFDTHDISKASLDTADVQATVNRNSMKESKMYGSKRRSYQEQGAAKIIVRHTENIDADVRGARSRKIESVFVETFEGERFKMPFESLPGTRAMAQHIGQGGRPYDDIGESITTMVNEIANLRPFVARNRNAIYEDETTMEMIESAREYYAETRKSLGKLKGKRGYKAYAESFEVTEASEFGDDTANSMKDRFTKKRFGDKMENAMPTVHKAYSLKKAKPKKPKMKTMSAITEFEEWTEEATKMPVDPIAEDCSSILSDEEKQQIKMWVNNQIEDLDDDLFEKLFQHYLENGEMPYGTAKARTGDPYQWMFDRMDQEYGNMTEAAEEMCSTECCGKPVSQCHCGPECPHCDCHEKNKAVKEGKWDGDEDFGDYEYERRKDAEMDRKFSDRDDEEFDRGYNDHKERNVNEVKSGPFNSKVVGRRAKVHGQSAFGDSDYNGQVGEIYRASREHTFSQMVPFKVVYAIRFDDGETREYRRENVRPVKAEPTSVTEGTWAVPDTPEKVAKLEELMASPLEFGVNGDNVTSAIYDLLGDDELFDYIAEIVDDFGPEEDARRPILDWMKRQIEDAARSQGTEVDRNIFKSYGTIIRAYAGLYQPRSGPGLADALRGEGLNEDQELTDSITHQMIHKLMKEYPQAVRRHGMDYVYNSIEDAVSWITDDWPEGHGFGSSDFGGIWRRIVKDLDLEQGVEEGRGRAPHERMKEGDVVLPKATYSDYLEVYKSSQIGGTDEDDDAKRMVGALEKKGKDADVNAAKGALKRMAEQAAKTGLHMNEGLNELEQLKRDAGLIK